MTIIFHFGVEIMAETKKIELSENDTFSPVTNYYLSNVNKSKLAKLGICNDK